MKNITLGQYYSVDSPIHRLDPRVKIILAVLYIVIVFLSANILSMTLLLLSAFVLIALSNIPIKIVLKSYLMKEVQVGLSLAQLEQGLLHIY